MFFYVCATPSGSGGGERFPSIRRWLVFNETTRGYYFVRLLRRPEQKHPYPTNPIRSHTITTSDISFGDESKNIPYQQVPFGLTQLLLQISPPETRTETSPIHISVNYRLLTIYSNCSSVNSVCIGKLNTSFANRSATGKSPAL